MASKSQSKTTTDHDEIRQWVEARNGGPAFVKKHPWQGDDTGILQIDFSGYSGSGSLEEISWEEFFEKSRSRETRSGLSGNSRARTEEQFQQYRQPRDYTSRARSRSGARKSGGRAASDTGRKRSRPAAKKRRAKPQAQLANPVIHHRSWDTARIVPELSALNDRCAHAGFSHASR